MSTLRWPVSQKISYVLVAIALAYSTAHVIANATVVTTQPVVVVRPVHVEPRTDPAVTADPNAVIVFPKSGISSNR